MRVIMLSGPMGAGKTTVARELLALPGAPPCYIEGDQFWSFFPAGAQPRRERFALIMRSMTAASVPLARSGHEVLLDFSIPFEFLGTARKILKEIPLHYIVLRPSLPVCARRAAERAQGRIAHYDHDFYGLFEGQPQNEISDDGLDPRAAAQRIRQGLDRGEFRIP